MKKQDYKELENEVKTKLLKQGFSLIGVDLLLVERCVEETVKSLNEPVVIDAVCEHKWWWKIKNTIIGTICLKCRYSNKI